MQKQFLSAVALVVFALACAGEASALAQRTFVSKFGDDANPCSATEPCRTFGAAIAQTQPGGEVIALDSAGYGPVTITKAISLISPPGVYAGITTTAAASAAITVDAGAGDTVVLKGLSLSGLGLGVDGIDFNSARVLRVEGLTISGFAGNGITFDPSVTSRLTVIDSLIRDNGSFGIWAFAAAGQLARVAVERTRVLGNDFGIIASVNGRVNVRDSVAAGNAQVGFYASNAASVLNLENSYATDNTWGIFSHGLVRAAGTTVTENTTGIGAGAAGTVLSRGNNTVEGNTNNGAFTGPFAAK